MGESSSGLSQCASDEGSSQPRTTTPPVSLCRIYSLCVINFGISAAWALEFALTTPYFSSTLRAGPVLSHFVWVVGPLSGLLVGPVVGTLSDNCRSKYGRRRPFVLFGALATIFGMALFSSATQIAQSVVPERLVHRTALVIAVFAFAIMDMAINSSMFPSMWFHVFSWFICLE